MKKYKPLHMNNFSMVNEPYECVMLLDKLNCIISTCMDLPLMKERDGVIGLKDFPSIIRQVFEDCGFIYHSKVTICKNAVNKRYCSNCGQKLDYTN